MKKLHELVTLITNNEDCVVLKVKPDAQMDLICLGCFSGDETMFRLTKGEDITCTIWKGSRSFSWHWGHSGYTLVSDETDKAGKLIQECIEIGLDILCKGSKASIKKDMCRTEDVHTIVLWDRDRRGTDWGCRKDDEYCQTFKSLDEGIAYFKAAGYVVSLTRHYLSPINFECYEYRISR